MRSGAHLHGEQTQETPLASTAPVCSPWQLLSPHTERSSRRDRHRASCQDAAPPFAEARSAVSRLVLFGINGEEVRGLDEWWVGDRCDKPEGRKGQVEDAQRRAPVPDPTALEGKTPRAPSANGSPSERKG